MSWFTRLRRDERGLLVLLFAIAVALLTLFVLVKRRTATYLVNGLAIPVTFDVAGERVVVQPDGHAEVRLPAGAHVARIAAGDGRAIDEVAFVVPRFHDAVVVNPLGAALVYVERVRYGFAAAGLTPDAELHGGARIVLARSVQDPFRRPPARISTKRGERVTRVHLDVAPGGAQRTIAHLLARGDAPRAIALATSLLEADPGDPALRTLLGLVAQRAGPAGVHALVSRERARGRGGLLAESLYEVTMGALGRHDELVAERRAARAARPDDPALAARVARVAPRTEARALFAELVGAHPADAELGLAAAEFALEDDRPADALALFERHARAPAHARSVEAHARTLAQLGWTQAAYDVLATALDASPDEDAARLAASLALLPHVKGDVHHLMAASGARRRAALLAELGAPTDASAQADPSLAAALLLIRRAAVDTPGAWLVWDRDLDDGARALVPEQTRLWLALEASRRGVTLAVDPIFSSPLLPAPIADVIAYVAGGEAPAQLPRASAPLRAVIEVCRARALAAAGRSTGDAEVAVARLSPGASLAQRLLAADVRERARAKP